MTWYTTADAARDAQRQGANKNHAGLLDSVRRLLDKPKTSKQVTGLPRTAAMTPTPTAPTKPKGAP